MNKFFLLTICFIVAVQAQTPLSLDECITVTHEKNASVREASQQLHVAKAQEKQAFTKWFPTVSAQLSALKLKEYAVNMDNSGGNLPVYDGNLANLSSATQFAYMPSSRVGLLDQLGVAQLTVVQPLYVGGQVRYGNQLARLGTDVARLQLDLAREAAVLATEDRYYTLLALEATRHTLLSQRDLLDTLTREVRLAYRAGLATSRDTLNLAHQSLTVQKYLVDLEAGITLAASDLCRSLDNYCTPPLQLSDTLGPLLSPEPLRVDHKTTRTQRKESRLLEQSVRAEELKGELERGKMRPQVLLGGSFFVMSDFEKDPTQNAIAFAQVTVPLTGFWEGSYVSSQNSAKKERVRIEANHTQDLLVLEMDKAWNDLEAAWRALELTLHQKEQELIAMSDARQRFAMGLEKSSDLVSAQASLQRVAEAEINARRVYLHHYSLYLKVTGR